MSLWIKIEMPQGSGTTKLKGRPITLLNLRRKPNVDHKKKFIAREAEKKAALKKEFKTKGL